MDRDEIAAMNEAVVAEFRSHNGVVGGMYDGMPILLLHTVGRRSGRPRLSPMTYQALSGGAVAVFASNGGSADHPAWYRNLTARDGAVVEFGDRSVAVSARTVSGSQRDDIWQRQVSAVPLFGELAAATTREIPVVVLEPRRVDLSAFAGVAAKDHFLAVVNTVNADGSIQSSVVNAGLTPHPLHGLIVPAFVAVGDARKIMNLRARRSITVVARAGWEWSAVTGTAQLFDVDDPSLSLTAAPQLFRDIFSAAGGMHDDWPAYDRAMRDERRTAVLVLPERSYGNLRS